MLHARHIWSSTMKCKLLCRLCTTPSVAFFQKLWALPNDRAVFRKNEWTREQGIKSRTAGFFDGSFVVGVTVTAPKSDAVGFVGLLQYRAIGIHENHRTEIRTLLPASCDLLASELDGS